MKLTTAFLLSTLLGASGAFAGMDGGKKGAKDLFLMDEGPAAQSPAPAPAAGGSAAPSSGGSASVSASSGGASVSAAAAPAQEAAPAGAGKYMGLSYWIELQSKGGQMSRASTKRIFKSGEAISLKVKSNQAGYLYAINLGSTGKATMMFPVDGVDNYVKVGQAYSIPAGKIVRFDQNPGEEQIMLMLSQTQLTDLSPENFKSQLAETPKVVAFAKKTGAKDLLLEDDAPPGKEFNASYAVAPVSTLQEGKTVNLTIKLKHGK